MPHEINKSNNTAVFPELTTVYDPSAKLNTAILQHHTGFDIALRDII